LAVSAAASAIIGQPEFGLVGAAVGCGIGVAGQVAQDEGWIGNLTHFDITAGSAAYDVANAASKVVNSLF
ncbi:MAG: hypothetical protein ACREP9_04480, partial [Candidatus Dormibacteraceae bacterium]